MNMYKKWFGFFSITFIILRINDRQKDKKRHLQAKRKLITFVIFIFFATSHKKIY
jgi:hypothetical protein